MPSWPAKGLSLTMNCMEIVGSEIFWNGIGSGFSGEQSVSPMEMSEIPEMATMDPIVASLTSILSSPSNS